MLTCSLIVWVLMHDNWEKNIPRKSFLTSQECLIEKINSKKNKNNSNSWHCIEIDKRDSFLWEEWEMDVCSLSEHKWNGKK